MMSFNLGQNVTISPLATVHASLDIQQQDSNVIEHKYTDHATEVAAALYCNPPLKFLSLDSHTPVKCGVTIPFPLKLHEMLDQIETDGLASVISWQSHGRCFVVHDPKRFSENVMPAYFRQTKFASFQRQLNLYGFSRLTSGKDKGGYYHELFLRGKKFLCHRIQRLKIKGTGVRKASSPDTEPQFYDMPPIDLVEGGGEEIFKEQTMLRSSSVSAPSSLWSNMSSDATPLSNLYQQQEQQEQQLHGMSLARGPQPFVYPQQQQSMSQDFTQVYTLPQMMQVQQQLPPLPNMIDWTNLLQQQQAQIDAIRQQIAMHQATQQQPQQQQPLISQLQHQIVPSQIPAAASRRYPDGEFDAILSALCTMPVDAKPSNKALSSLLNDESLGTFFEMLTE